MTDADSQPSGYPIVIELPVQWGDQDAFGHVNNTIYFRWFESSRIAYLERLGLAHKSVGSGSLGPILAAMTCNYRRQLWYPDRVRIGARVARVGRTSMTLEHAVWSTAHSALAADATSTVVVYDYEASRPRPVPDEIRAAVAALEGEAR